MVGRRRRSTAMHFQSVALLSCSVFEKSGVNEVSDRAFRRHYGHVYRYLRRRTGDHHRAEELTQQVFADAVVSLGEAESSSLPWLYTVARRRFVDELRRGAVGQRNALPALVPAQQVEYGSDVAAALRVAIAQLPEGQRQVVVLKLLRGATFAE